MISKTHRIDQKPYGRQLNAKVCGSKSASFVILKWSAMCASAYEILKSTGFHVDFQFQNGFLDFKVDFWISKWIAGFQSGFLDLIRTAIILNIYS